MPATAKSSFKMIDALHSLSTYLEEPNSKKLLFDRRLAAITETIFDSLEATQHYDILLPQYRNITSSTPLNWKEDKKTAEQLTRLWLNTIAASAAKEKISLKQAISNIDETILDKKKKKTLKRVARRLLADALDEWKNKPQPAVKKAVSADRILKAYDDESPSLDLSNKELDTLPDLFHFLPQLNIVYLQGNNPVAIPDTLFFLTNLGLTLS